MTTYNKEIETANNNIVSLLNDAGVEGLHSDDILYLLGYSSKKELLARLNQLKTNKEIIQVEGSRWKNNKESTDMNGTNLTRTETFISPSCKEDLPTVHLPGHEKFSSYKNTLQEYCQKKKYSVPQYKALRESNGLIGTVSFALNFVRSTEVSGSVKEADSHAAFEALKLLGYLMEGTFQVMNQLKRKEDDAAYDSTVAKIMKSGNNDQLSHKSQLNEYAQKRQVPIPKYETVAVTGGFFSTVIFNDVKYKGTSIFPKRKDAEKSAAHVALNALVGTPLTSGEKMELGEAEVSKMIAEARQASTPVGLKNRLQEYCQRMGYALPVYETKLLEDDNKQKIFQSIVTVQGIGYTGSQTQGKKNAETSAAEASLKALGLMA